MVEQGARSVILLGRNPASAAAEDAIRAMQQTGAQISVLRGDVSRSEELARTLEEIGRSLPPLRGIVHAAGVLDDGILFKQSWERFVRVMAPKVAGAWNLHELTRGRPLDFFVMFSSAAALLGSPGQSNYAAANAFLDVLAHHRRSLGLPALTIGWGPWSQVGMAADLAKRSGRQWIPQGVTALDPADGLRVLGRLMKESRAQVGVLPVVWAEFLKQFPAGERPRVLAEVTADIERSEETIDAKSASAILARLNEANGRERRDILVDYIQGEAARVMGMDDESPDPELGFFDMGLDSLMAVELKNHLSMALGVSLPATMVFRYPNIGTLARFLLTDVLALAEPVTTNGNGGAATDEVDDLAEISEDGLLAMLSDELGRIDSDRAGKENIQ
jgi:acyl carrier protein